jgi:L-asparaginase
VRNGALLADDLRPSQARILLAALVATEVSREHIARAFAARAHRYTDTADDTVTDARPGAL